MPSWKSDRPCRAIIRPGSEISLSVSARAREFIGRLRPAAIRVLTFWDHAVRAATIGGRLFEIDPSGCYRLR